MIKAEHMQDNDIAQRMKRLVQKLMVMSQLSAAYWIEGIKLIQRIEAIRANKSNWEAFKRRWLPHVKQVSLSDLAMFHLWLYTAAVGT
jgi:hypothetical protein